MERRAFLRSALYFTVAPAALTLAACGSDSDPVGTYVFTHGVASGDPKETSLVFWTRCVRADGATTAVDVDLEVATTADFSTVVARVPLQATATFDNTLRAKVTGLKAATSYWYRFVAGQDKSVVGKSRTAPAASTANAQVRFAWFTCQDWSVNHWAAMELMAAEELDFLVHLGDYIYETVGASFQSGKVEPAHALIKLPDGVALSDGGISAVSLADYRTLYKTYRGDARLQALHAKCAFIAVWDDHEFSDDAWQDHQTYTNANVQQTARRRAANQAWAEYMPVDFGDVSFDLANTAYDNIRIYRDFRFGTLLHLVMTDERLYRDDHVVSEALIAQQTGADPVNGDSSIGARYFVPQTVLGQLEAMKTAQLGRAPSILGTTQTQWWKSTLKNSTATWKVWGNEVTLNRMWIDLTTLAPAPYNQRFVVNCDGWDGYPSHRAELMNFLQTEQIKNVVAITGDLHAFQCGVIRTHPDPLVGTPVMVDFVGAGISSSSFYSYLKAGSSGTPLTALTASPQVFDGVMSAHNPDFKYVDHDAQGFSIMTLTPTQLSVTFYKMKPLNADGTKPASALLKRTTMTLAAGSTMPTVSDNV